MQKKINNNDYEEICPTALVTSYPRYFTDIPHEKDIYNWLKENNITTNTLYKNLAPEIEARYKLINKLLNKSNIKQVLELASGYSSRGITYSKQGYKYVELDLEPILKNKKRMVDDLNYNSNNLVLQCGNALNQDDINLTKKYFDNTKELAIINEGLLRYLTFAEKKIVAENIYSLLREYGGIWITSDVTPKKFIGGQNQALPNFNQDVANITSRNNLHDRFEDENHIKKFFGDIGLEVMEIHRFSEIKNELYSVNELNIFDDKIAQTLNDAIVVIMQVKR